MGALYSGCAAMVSRLSSRLRWWVVGTALLVVLTTAVAAAGRRDVGALRVWFPKLLGSKPNDLVSTVDDVDVAVAVDGDSGRALQSAER